MSRHVTLVDALLPDKAVVRDVGVIGACVGLTALAAQAAVRLPFTPVPVTGQTFAVLLSGVVLGSRRGAAAMTAYLALGCAGLPVFAGGGHGMSLGASGGYLLGFAPAAYVVGLLAEKGWLRRTRTAWAAMLLGNAIIYLFGLPWLAAYVGGSFSKTLALGLAPFIPGDLVKIALASAAVPSAWMLVGRHHSTTSSHRSGCDHLGR